MEGAGDPYAQDAPAPGALTLEPRVFGVQRPARDVAALALLLTGFSALACAFWILHANWAGLLLPIGFLIGAFSSLRTEVREIELREEVLIVRTFLREYPIPRAHVTKIVRTPQGASVEVLNGNRYLVTPPDTDAAALSRRLEEWLTR